MSREKRERERGETETYPVEISIVPKERSEDDEIWWLRETGRVHLRQEGLFDSVREDCWLGLAWEPIVEILTEKKSPGKFREDKTTSSKEEEAHRLTVDHSQAGRATR